MPLATLPPAVEIVEEFQSSRPILNLSAPYWTDTGFTDEPSWRTTAFWKISAFRSKGRDVPGLGNLRPSDQAALKLRKLLNSIRIQSLPLPTVAPVSGGAIFVSWKNGAKSVEVTAYDDGEIVLEGLVNQDLNEEISETDLASMLNWLVQR